MVESVYNWHDGKKHGKFFLYDSVGEKVNEGLYRNDTLIAELFKQPVVVKPYLKRCETEYITDVHSCTEAVLTPFLYSELRYPSSAKQNKIEGTVIAQWVVAADGSIEDISVPLSLSNDIRDEVIRVLKKMPEWRPATKDGVPIHYTMSLPLNFKL